MKMEHYPYYIHYGDYPRIQSSNAEYPDLQMLDHSSPRFLPQFSIAMGQKMHAEALFEEENLSPPRSKRSRTGCLTCRSRKKRCDETKCGTSQACTECRRLNLLCKWPAPGTERKNRTKRDIECSHDEYYHEKYGKIKLLRGIVEQRMGEEVWEREGYNYWLFILITFNGLCYTHFCEPQAEELLFRPLSDRHKQKAVLPSLEMVVSE